MATHMLRLKRTDKTNEHLLLRVTQQKGLDLKLIGTEHEHLYHTKLGESNLKSLQSNQFSGSLEEFKDILRYALLHERSDGPLPDALQGLEAVAVISGATLTVTIRKNIGGITQRLGAINLEQDDEREEVSPFEWVDSAIATADNLRSTLEGLQTEMNGQQDQVARLSQQLDDLVKAKKAHEDELLKKFAALLNTKKLKVRDQQRLLKGATIDPEAAEEVVDDVRPSRRKAQSSRSSKRKSEQAAESENGDEGEDENEEERQLQETPPGSDEGATDDDDLDGAVTSRPTTARAETANGSGGEEMNIGGPQEAPPRRHLPFQRKSNPSPQPADEDDEDETDEEL